MIITVNQKPTHVPEACSLSTMLTTLKQDARYIAIAVNREFVPKNAYEVTRLTEHDCVDIVTPLQGG